MTLAGLVKLVKRTARIGDINVTTDQVTSDIIEYTNKRRFKFWRAWYWDWSVEEFTNTVSANADPPDFTVASTIGGILVMYISGEDGYLKNLTLKRYLQWVKTKTEGAGTPTHYLKLGRDSSGNMVFRLWKAPSSNVTVKGWGKKRLTKYVVADIATNTGLEFFPEEVHDILFTGVMADVKDLMNLPVEAAVKNNEFTSEINALIGEEENQPDEELSSPPPDRYIYNRRKRGGTTVV